MAAPTLDEVRTWPAAVDVTTAAKALGISPSTAYEWIKIGQFPARVISVRGGHRVVTAGLVRLLSETNRPKAVGPLPEKPRGRPGQGRPPEHSGRYHDSRAQAATAYASVFVPQGKRTRHWLTFRCPVCDVYVFARGRRIDDVTGPRRTTCGHRVKIVAARIYSPPDGEAA